MIVLCSLFAPPNVLVAATDTNSDLPGPGQISVDLSATNSPAMKAPSSDTPAPQASTNPPSSPVPIPQVAAPAVTETSQPNSSNGKASNGPELILAALLTLATLGGFLLYQTGLTRAKNVGHTSTLLLVGVLFGLTGYWIGGFAVQTGGIGDAHAALGLQLDPVESSALDHELGPMAFGHHWGLMGSSGFFLATEDSTREGIALLFLFQAAMLVIVLAAALGGALERSKLLAMGFCAYLFGVLVYPLLANWVWGGGWLAELGREFGLGHGYVDVGGSGVVNETAGTLALVLAVVLGPRHGRFGRNNPTNVFPGHHVPFFVLGCIVLLISWMASNAFAANSGLAAVNTLLAATGGMLVSFIQASVQRQRPEPARLCRGLLGGAVSSCGCAGLIDPWAAFVIGGVAALLVQAVVKFLENKRIDDPVGASAVHGASGAWGVLAVGLFANGSAGNGLNGVPQTVRGLFFGGAWHQLAAQAIGCVTGFAVVYLLGSACVTLVQKILGNRVELADEASGLDWPEVGAFGYHGDGDAEASADDGKPAAEK